MKRAGAAAIEGTSGAGRADLAGDGGLPTNADPGEG
jgi:hypothetical protein